MNDTIDAMAVGAIPVVIVLQEGSASETVREIREE